MKSIYLIVGVPGSGKTWVMNQLKDINGSICISQDNYMDDPKGRLNIVEYAYHNGLNVFTETPFSVNNVLIPLQERGLNVETVFIIESPEVVSKRYTQRTGKPLPKGNLTRLETYKERAAIMGAFQGTSQQVLDYLRKAVQNGL